MTSCAIGAPHQKSAGLFLISPSLPTVPVVDFPAGPIFRVSVSLQESAFELVLLACDDIEIIIGQLAPLLLDLCLHFLPVAFNPIPVHRGSPTVRVGSTRSGGHRSFGGPATD